MELAHSQQSSSLPIHRSLRKDLDYLNSIVQLKMHRKSKILTPVKMRLIAIK